MQQQAHLQQVSQDRFELYRGDLIGLPVDRFHHVYRFNEPGCKVLFSVTRKGGSVSIHFASDKHGLRVVKQAVNEFCEMCFSMYDWCEMVLAVIEKPSVMRLADKCGFTLIGHLEDENSKIYMRQR